MPSPGPRCILGSTSPCVFLTTCFLSRSTTTITWHELRFFCAGSARHETHAPLQQEVHPNSRKPQPCCVHVECSHGSHSE